MTEQLLDDSEVGASLEEVRRERVSQRVRGDVPDACGVRDTLDDGARVPGAERPPAITAQDDPVGARVPSGTRPSGTRPTPRGPVLIIIREQRGSTTVEVRGECSDRCSADRDDPILPTLALESDLGLREVEPIEREGASLVDACARRVQQFQQCPITGPRRRPRVGDIDHRLDLFDPKHPRQVSTLLR